MTKEEAINRLRDMITEILAICDESKHMSEDDRQDIETFNMAIESLKQEPCEDCISRKALLNRLRDFTEWCQDRRLQGALFVSDVVADMPSVQPKSATFCLGCNEYACCERYLNIMGDIYE